VMPISSARCCDSSWFRSARLPPCHLSNKVGAYLGNQDRYR
jgi:hypothetical protein